MGKIHIARTMLLGQREIEEAGVSGEIQRVSFKGQVKRKKCAEPGCLNVFNLKTGVCSSDILPGEYIPLGD